MPVTYDQITPRETLYLCKMPAIPRGDVTLFFGEGSVGKGRMLCSFISGVTNGAPLGMDTEGGEPGDVVVVFPEDKPDEQVAWRLRAAGADLSRVHDMTRLDDGGRFKLSASPDQRGHLSLLRAKVEQLQDTGRNPRMVIIDPIAAVKGSGRGWGSMLTNDGIRHMMEGLQDLADMTGISVVLVGHTVTGGKLQGSMGFQQALRWVYRVEEDRTNAALRVVKVEKANNLPRDYPELRFTITEDENGLARVVWMDRERLEEKRTEWRKPRLAFLHGRKVDEPQSGPAGTYSAVCKVGGTEHVLGSGLTLEAAQEACQGLAGGPLDWRPDLTAASKTNRASFALRAS